MRQTHSALRRQLPSASSSSRRRSITSQPPLNLWSGTTSPPDHPPAPLSPAAGTGIAIPSPLSTAESIERQHSQHVQKLLDLTAMSVSGLEKSSDSRLKCSVPGTHPRRMPHSLSEPPLFRTDGSLTPYPIELDSGEVLEPTHATRVVVLDRAGEEKEIVVAEVENGRGKSKKVLLAVDVEGYQGGGEGAPVAGRKLTGEAVYKTEDLEPPKSEA